MPSEWSTQGQYACPSCHIDTHSQYLKFGWKYCCMGHHRFLESDHKFHHESYSFDNNKKFDFAPTPLTGVDILKLIEGYVNTFRKKIESTSEKRKKNDNADKPKWWKKMSIFFSLFYWKDLFLHHNIDAMHIEKNIYNNMLNIKFLLCGAVKK